MAVLFALGSSLTVYADNTSLRNTINASAKSTPESSALHSMPNEQSDEFEISVGNVGAKTATLSWNDIGDGASYSVIRYNEDTLKQERYAVTNDTFIEMTNLTPNTQYKFIIATALSNRYLVRKPFWNIIVISIRNLSKARKCSTRQSLPQRTGTIRLW